MSNDIFPSFHVLSGIPHEAPYHGTGTFYRTSMRKGFAYSLNISLYVRQNMSPV